MANKNNNKTAGNSETDEAREDSELLTLDHLEQVIASDSDFPEISFDAKADVTPKKLHREAKLDFAKLSANKTIGQLQAEAQLIEEENQASESPLDRYVRQHRQEVESVKVGFGKELDKVLEREKRVLSKEAELFAKSEKGDDNEVSAVDASLSAASLDDEAVDERAAKVAVDSSTSEAEYLKDSSRILDSLETVDESTDTGEVKALTVDKVRHQVEEAEVGFEERPTQRLAHNGFAHAEMVDTSIFPAPTFKELDEEAAKLNQQLDSLEINSESEIPEKIVSTFNSRRSRISSFSDSEIEESEMTSEAITSESDASVISEVPETIGEANVTDNFAEESAQPIRRKIVVGLVVVAFLVAAGLIAGAVATHNQAGKNQASSSRSSSAAQQLASEQVKFNKAYDAFFTDSNKTALKNSSFDSIDQLKQDLAVIPQSNPNYAGLKAKYDDLQANIEAIKSVNALFDKSVIMDGKLDSTATLKTGVTLPSVSSKNITINAILDQALNLAKSQQAAESSKAQSSETQASSSAVAVVSPPVSPTSPAGSSSLSTTESGNYSQNPYGVSVNNSSSRVPIQNVDPNSPAFAWPAGYLNNVISQMQSRGFISGNNYILLPVAIDTAQEGWYNIYRPDGSYLFSINCKTGLWAGTGSAHPDLGASF